MSQSEILSILDHPMTAKQIAGAANLPVQCTKDNLCRMRKNKSVAICGKIGKQLVYGRPGHDGRA